jgi:prevent-host-death family protein
MKVLTATQVARNLSAVLDDVDHGETVVITRDGRELAILTPVPAANGAATTAALSDLPDDDAYWDAVEAAHEEVGRSWPAA